MAAVKQTLNFFRKTALIEGISMVVLVTLSVLKRTIPYEWPALGVTYVGWVHGLLFVAYVYLLFICQSKYKWSWGRVIVFFIASLVPFAPFFVDRKLKDEAQAIPA